MRIIKIGIVSLDRGDFDAYSKSLGIHPFTHGWYMVSGKEDIRPLDFFATTPRAGRVNEDLIHELGRIRNVRRISI